MNAQPTATGLSARDLAVAGVMNLMWGLNLIAVKMSVELVSPLTAAALRQIMVFLICLPALKVVPGKMRELIGLGLLSGALFYVLVNMSLAVADNVGALAIAGQLGVPFSLILAVIFLGERIQKYRIAGMALAFAGIALIAFDPAALHELPGIAFTAAASAVWAVSSLIQRRLKGVQVLTIYAWMGLVGCLALAPLAALVEPQSVAALPAVPLSTLGWILFSALGSTVIGHGSMSWLLQRHQISAVVPLTLLAPVLSVLFGSLYFHQPLTPILIVGGIVTMAGVAIVTFRTARAKEAEGQA